MTFDDGMLRVYSVTNVAEKGDMPKNEPKLKGVFYFEYETVGYGRYYSAMAVKEQIEETVVIDIDRDIHTNDMVKFEDGTQMRIVQAQHARDESGMWFTRLSLTRWLNDD